MIEIIAKAVPIAIEKGDYKQDGLLYCGKCHTPKQCRVQWHGEERIMPCVCHCKAAEMGEEERKIEEARDYRMVQSLKANGIHDKQIEGWTFANDDGQTPAMIDKAMRYCLKWQQMYSDNIGLIFWGGVGTGKTYAAACIANYLLEQKTAVLMTNFTKIINMLSDYSIDRNGYLDSLSRYKLLVIDDLGVERQSEAAMEKVFAVIDVRYKSGQPLIVTTNLTLEELKRPTDVAHARVYDRLLEMCVPIRADGESRRKAAHKEKLEKAKGIFE